FSGGKVLDKIDDVSKYCDAVTDPSDAVASNEHGSVFALAWSPDGKRCAAGLGGGAILFDWKNGVERLGGQLDSTYAVAFSPDGPRVVMAADELIVYDAATHKTLHRLGRDQGPYVGVAVTADGARAVAAGADGRYWLLNLNDATLTLVCQLAAGSRGFALTP